MRKPKVQYHVELVAGGTKEEAEAAMKVVNRILSRACIRIAEQELAAETRRNAEVACSLNQPH